MDTYRGDVEKALGDLERWRADAYRVLVVHPGHGPAHRTVEALAERDVPARLVEAVDPSTTCPPASSP